jgi:hypothetical protein
MTLRYLPDTPSDVEAILVRSVPGALKALRNGMAATAADDNGAINVWRTDDGKYRCLSCRHLQTIDYQVFDKAADVAAWTKTWLKKIQ